MDGPLFAAINAPVAEALLAYRSARLGAAKAIAKMNGGQNACSHALSRLSTDSAGRFRRLPW